MGDINDLNSPFIEIISPIPYINVIILEENLFGGAKEVVSNIRKDWNNEEIVCQLFKDGYTNKLVACTKQSDYESMNNVVLVRIYGKGSGDLINREHEKISMVALHSIGCAPPLYGSFRNGIVYGYMPGVTLDFSMTKDKKIQRLLAKELVKMHSVTLITIQNAIAYPVPFVDKPNIFSELYKWLEFIPDKFEDPIKQAKFDSIQLKHNNLKEEIEFLEGHLSNLGSPVVFCHNDLLHKNIIYNKQEEKVSFIDFEYTFFNYQAFDIANFFCEFVGMEEIDFSLYPSRTYQMDWLRTFLEYSFKSKLRSKKEVTERDVEILYVQVNKFTLAAHIFWAMWGMIQSNKSTIKYDYLDFARLRLTEYLKRKDEMINLQFPE